MYIRFQYTVCMLLYSCLDLILERSRWNKSIAYDNFTTTSESNRIESINQTLILNDLPDFSNYWCKLNSSFNLTCIKQMSLLLAWERKAKNHRFNQSQQWYLLERRISQFAIRNHVVSSIMMMIDVYKYDDGYVIQRPAHACNSARLVCGVCDPAVSFRIPT